MTIERYKDVSQMPPPPRPPKEKLLEAIAAAWERAHLRGVPELPRGVEKFRDIEEANAARRERTLAHMRRLRAPSAGGG